MLRVVTRWEAARRGAVVAVLWAVVTVSLLASIGEVVERRATHSGVQKVALGLLEAMRDIGITRVACALLLAFAVAGTATGLVGRVLLVRPALRFVIVAVATFPALWLGSTAMWAVMLFWTAAPHIAPSIFWLPVGAAWWATVGVSAAAPVLLLPAVCWALLVEGWTRPEALPQTGLARPGVLRWFLRGLGVAATALTTFAALNGWRIGPP